VGPSGASLEKRDKEKREKREREKRREICKKGG
jgi:hypothetical protein